MNITKQKLVHMSKEETQTDDEDGLEFENDEDPEDDWGCCGGLDIGPSRRDD